MGSGKGFDRVSRQIGSMQDPLPQHALSTKMVRELNRQGKYARKQKRAPAPASGACDRPRLIGPTSSKNQNVFGQWVNNSPMAVCHAGNHCTLTHSTLAHLISVESPGNGAAASKILEAQNQRHPLKCVCFCCTGACIAGEEQAPCDTKRGTSKHQKEN